MKNYDMLVDMNSSNPEPMRIWNFSPEKCGEWMLKGRITFANRTAEDCYDLQPGEFVEAIFKPGRYGIALTLEIGSFSTLADGNVKVYFGLVENEVRRPTPKPPRPRRAPVVFVPLADMPRRRPRY